MWNMIIQLLLNKASENSPGLRKIMPFANAKNLFNGNENGMKGFNDPNPWG